MKVFFSQEKKKQNKKNKTISLNYPYVYKLLNYKGMNDVENYFF